MGAVLVGGAAVLLARSRGTPDAVLRQDQDDDPWKWSRRVGLAGAGLYAGNKLLNYLNTIEVPAPRPVPQESKRPPIDSLEDILRAIPAPAANKKPEASWVPDPDARWLSLAPHPSVIFVIGKRGSGKSALGYRLLELYRDQAAPYVVGLPSSARKLLPGWVGCADGLEGVPPGAVVLLDEAFIQLHARDSMSKEGRDIGTIVNLSRQRRQTLIFIVQEARQLDVNAISQADVIAVKELSEISKEFERRELRRFTDKAGAAFATLHGDKRRWTWIYSEAAGEVGLIENNLASFWRPALSHAFAGAHEGPQTMAQQRKGERTPREELAARAKSMRQAGHSYGQVAKTLGVAKSTAFALVNED